MMFGDTGQPLGGSNYQTFPRLRDNAFLQACANQHIEETCSVVNFLPHIPTKMK